MAPCLALNNAALARIGLWQDTQRWNAAATWNTAAARAAAVAEEARRRPRRASAVYQPVAPGSLSSVVQCIKNHESGNYNEASHPGSGSGAFQFIPGTWRAWFGRWRSSLSAAETATVPYYSLAYQAPPEIQDAVLHYTLTHGGASNWSNRFGNDPCTAGLPGGG
jgi:hypothetical protein